MAIFSRTADRSLEIVFFSSSSFNASFSRGPVQTVFAGEDKKCKLRRGI